MKRILAVLFLVLFTGCAKQIIIPPPDTVSQIKAVTADTTLAPETKSVLIQQVIQEYKDWLARLDNQGKNIKEIILQILGVAAATTTAVLAATQ